MQYLTPVHTLKYLLFITLFVGCFVSAFAQEPDTIQMEQKMFKPKGNPACIYKNKYSVAERNKIYPFSIADTIKLVSFRYHRKNIAIAKDTVITDSLIETTVLSSLQVDSLTDILYNTFYKKMPNYGSVTQCNFPRNAILFFDKSGKLKEYIIFCFHCDRHEESSDKISMGDECSQKMEKLKHFFITMNIKYGTNTDVDSFPGEDSFADIVYPPLNISNN